MEIYYHQKPQTCVHALDQSFPRHELLRISDLALNAAGHALQSFPNASGTPKT